MHFFREFTTAAPSSVDHRVLSRSCCPMPFGMFFAQRPVAVIRHRPLVLSTRSSKCQNSGRTKFIRLASEVGHGVVGLSPLFDTQSTIAATTLIATAFKTYIFRHRKNGLIPGSPPEKKIVFFLFLTTVGFKNVCMEGGAIEAAPRVGPFTRVGSASGLKLPWHFSRCAGAPLCIIERAPEGSK